METGGRFGASLASLGDLDHDGYEDLAVGAPYAGRIHSEDSYGAVIVFRGGPDGIGKSPSQIIHANQFDTKVRGFGFAISGGTDLDRNNYPDLVVGAPDSGQTFYFRSRPVVRVDAQVRLETVDGQINPEVKNCTLTSGIQVSCLTIEACLQYEGEQADDVIGKKIYWFGLIVVVSQISLLPFPDFFL